MSCFRRSKRISKVRTLQAAIDYINSLSDILNEHSESVTSTINNNSISIANSNLECNDLIVNNTCSSDVHFSDTSISGINANTKSSRNTEITPGQLRINRMGENPNFNSCLEMDSRNFDSGTIPGDFNNESSMSIPDSSSIVTRNDSTIGVLGENSSYGYDQSQCATDRENEFHGDSVISYSNSSRSWQDDNLANYYVQA